MMLIVVVVVAFVPNCSVENTLPHKNRIDDKKNKKTATKFQKKTTLKINNWIPLFLLFSFFSLLSSFLFFIFCDAGLGVPSLCHVYCEICVTHTHNIQHKWAQVFHAPLQAATPFEFHIRYRFISQSDAIVR